ncbi:hypothetical protein CBR_g19060 [Chara braunii]|uniref:Reverse transcriptase domain-containing protein n=1 Tax=Chara braunii TaxID=69332 RepID=A0A388KXF0_CHABU|nr:hypothetical protein CBR_g19060 [Chara braunii]|eukprot:GBG74652.1 hypothetical protein CBR_g19060 [Chara braunii]
MSLSVAQREQLIRVYEEAWYQDADFNPMQKRGRTHGEGPNVSSYVARTERIARWLIAKGEDRIPIRNGSVKVRFKPWMTRQELDVIRDNEAAGRFRIIALRVPLEALPSLRFAVQRFMGRVLVMHPPERRADEPRLGNIQIDCVPEVRQTFLEWIVVRKPSGGFVEVQFANQDTPFCNKCLWWYHDEFDTKCPRFGEPMPEGRGGRRGRGRGARGRGRGSGQRGTQARERCIEEDECREMVKEAEQRIGKDPYTDLYWERRREDWLRKWDLLQVEQQEVWARRAKERGMTQLDRMTKKTFKRLCPPRSHGIIRALKHPFNAQADLAEDTETMADYALDYYKDILTSRRPPEQTLADMRQEADLWCSTDKRLEPNQRLLLDRPLTLQELQEAVKSMARGKTPGDDGLPMEFYEATWDQIGPILLKLFNNVLEGGRLTEDMCRGTITLIYKKGDKQNVRNWRPISLLNVSYKILAKALSRRLAKILPDLVRADQGAFVKGRSIAENILVAMGALEVISKEKRQVMVAMLDLEKAYDRVNWSFVLATLDHMNFGVPFRRRISAMYCHSTATVLINGRQSQEFKLSRSLKQDCPLAPLMFVLQMEVTVLLNSLRAAPLVKGQKLKEDVEVLTGAIADDLLLITEATEESTSGAKLLLDQYSGLSEAKVNWDKSSYFLPTEYELQDDWTMKRIDEKESERYLGVQVSLTNSRPAQDAVLIGRVEAGINRCKAAPGISLMGRATMITAVVFFVLWHVATVLLISKPTIRKVKAAAAKYLWKPHAEEKEGHISKVAWDKVVKPKEEGGLGIVDPEGQNLTLLGKWIKKVAMQDETRNWMEIALYILQQEFQLSRSEDVWTCLRMVSFGNRRPRSALGLVWWIAWRKLKPKKSPPPIVKEEVLVQHLFDNERILKEDGLPFSAAAVPRVNFERKWVERGIVKIQDIRVEERNGWKTESEVRVHLGRLRGVGEKLSALTATIPPE